MRVIDDFACPNGHVFEALENRDVTQVRCKECDSKAQRKRAVPKFHLNGADAGFPTAHDRWARDHERGGAQSTHNL